MVKIPNTTVSAEYITEILCFFVTLSLSLSLSLSHASVSLLVFYLSVLESRIMLVARWTYRREFVYGGACGALCFTPVPYQLRLHKTRCYCCTVFSVSLLCYIAVIQLYTFVYRFSRLKSSTSLMSLVIHPHNKGNLSFYASEFISILYTQKLSYTSTLLFSQNLHKYKYCPTMQISVYNWWYVTKI